MDNRVVQSSKRIINLEKQQEQETWHKLVVKIICWSDKHLHNLQTSKISKSEWEHYSKQIVKNSADLGKDKAIKKLKFTEETIKRNSGFDKF